MMLVDLRFVMGILFMLTLLQHLILIKIFLWSKNNYLILPQK